VTAERTVTDSIQVLAAGSGAVWVVEQISISQDRIVGQARVPERPTSLAVGLGAVWVTHQDGTVTKVDPVTLQAATIARFEGPARAIVVDEARESLWVEVNRE
jgi:hypothetical protein